jgi:aerobic-type carbon monoxide dehydrogenase small subunit (CoxS/CutS family)
MAGITELGRWAACTVPGGQPAKCCITKLAGVVRRIVTMEGLAPRRRTPGMSMGAVGLLKGFPNASEAYIAGGMDVPIYRCATCPRVAAAIPAAARKGVQA